MPELSINENSKVPTPENEIRAAKKRPVPPPADNPVITQQSYEAQLCASVPSGTDEGHHRGALLGRKYVTHEDIT